MTLEQRAHDLAVIYMQGQIEHNIIEIHESRKSDLNEFTKCYIDIYQVILDCLNRDLL